MSEFARIMQYGLCHEGVTRKGEFQPCEKTAVAVRIDPEDGGPYPVCAYHARGEMVSLADLLTGLTQGEGTAEVWHVPADDDSGMVTIHPATVTPPISRPEAK